MNFKTDALLTISLQNEFKEWKNQVEVLSFMNREKKLIDFVRMNSASSFFMDEVLADKDALSTETIAKISRIIHESNYLWISCVSDKLPSMHDNNLKGTFVISSKIFYIISA